MRGARMVCANGTSRDKLRLHQALQYSKAHPADYDRYRDVCFRYNMRFARGDTDEIRRQKIECNAPASREATTEDGTQPHDSETKDSTANR